MEEEPLWLVRCRVCDDVQRLIERERVCVCGASRGRVSDGKPELEGIAAELVTVSWEDFDARKRTLRVSYDQNGR